MTSLAGVTPLVRVPTPNSPGLARMIDAGCLGAVVLHVESADGARLAVDSCKFAPPGRRGVTANWPQLGYRNHPPAQIRAAINDAMTVIAMIESPEGLERCEEIAAVDGIDIVQLGCNDFCDALGVPGQLRDPRVEEAMSRVIAACAKYGKVAGVGGLRSDPALTAQFDRAGVRYIAASNEWNSMRAAAAQAAQELRDCRA